MVFLTLMIIVAPQIEGIRSISKYLVQIMVGFLILGFLFLFLNKRKLLLTCFGLSGVLCVFLKNQSNNELVAPQPSNDPKISIAHINLANVDDAFDLVGVINKLQSDVISFQELTPDWAEVISRFLNSTYPYFTEMIRIDPYGKAIYSKYPIRTLDTIPFENINDFDACIQVENVLFHLVSSYIVPSLDKKSTARARKQMDCLTQHISKNKNGNIVFGEFNMVYWDEEIIRFRNENILNNSRKDVLPTALRVPLDHIFYSQDLICLKFGDIVSEKGTKYGSLGIFQTKPLSETSSTEVHN